MVDPAKMKNFLTTKKSEFTLEKQEEYMAVYYSFVSANLSNINLSFPNLLDKDLISLFQKQIKSHIENLSGIDYNFSLGQNILFIEEEIKNYEIEKIKEIFKSFLTMSIFEDNYENLTARFRNYNAGDYYKTISFNSFAYYFVQEYSKIKDYISFDFLTEDIRVALSIENNISINEINEKIVMFILPGELEKLKKNVKDLFVLEMNRYNKLYPNIEKNDHFLKKYSDFINIDEILVSLRLVHLYKIENSQASTQSLISFIKKILSHIDDSKSNQRTFEEIELLKYVLLNNTKTKNTVFKNDRKLFKEEFNKEKILKSKAKYSKVENEVVKKPDKTNEKIFELDESSVEFDETQQKIKINENAAEQAQQIEESDKAGEVQREGEKSVFNPLKTVIDFRTRSESDELFKNNQEVGQPQKVEINENAAEEVQQIAEEVLTNKKSKGFFGYISHFFKTIFSGILKFFSFIFALIYKLFK